MLQNPNHIKKFGIILEFKKNFLNFFIGVLLDVHSESVVRFLPVTLSF